MCFDNRGATLIFSLSWRKRSHDLASGRESTIRSDLEDSLPQAGFSLCFAQSRVNKTGSFNRAVFIVNLLMLYDLYILLIRHAFW